MARIFGKQTRSFRAGAAAAQIPIAELAGRCFRDDLWAGAHLLDMVYLLGVGVISFFRQPALGFIPTLAATMQFTPGLKSVVVRAFPRPRTIPDRAILGTHAACHLDSTLRPRGLTSIVRNPIINVHRASRSRCRLECH